MPANVRAFLKFRVLFNARFYYPVLAVFFVDLGLTLDQYAILNVAWAASIVLCELPLGALADRIGRRPLIVGAAALMVVEMGVMAFAPTGNPTLLFGLFLVNRLLSGLAEAAASGADEALAYDTLANEGRASEWPNVLAMLQRRLALAFFLSMIVGAAVYDPDFVNGLFGTSFDQLTTARFPVYLTLVLALGALKAALEMTEPRVERRDVPAATWTGIRTAGRFVRTTRVVLAVILFTLLLDSFVRLFLTLLSSYFRLIEIPAAYFGLIGAGYAALRLGSPPIAQGLIRRCSALEGFGLISMLVMIGLFGAAWAGGWWGAVLAIPMVLGFALLDFLASHYLNAATPSEVRATVLSFKSLAGNLAYGAAGVLYAVGFRAAAGGLEPAPGSPEENAAFAQTLVWIPACLAAALLPLLFWGKTIPKLCLYPRRQPADSSETKNSESTSGS